MEALFRKGDVWTGGMLIRVPESDEPCVISPTFDEACKIACDRINASIAASENKRFAKQALGRAKMRGY